MSRMNGRAAIVGAGLMGAQIGAEYALGGYEVALCTRSEASGQHALGRAGAAIELLSRHELVAADDAAAAQARMSATTDLGAACADAAILVESLPESLEAKGPVLRRAAALAPEALIVSNTSSLPITDIGEACGAPERTVGTHYWNPPTLMPLVEVIPGERTRSDVVERTIAILRALGKEPVVVRDVPGFVWNRLQFALLREAASLVADGVTDAATVDLIVRRGLARRWALIGPFETMALGGRDTFLSIARWLFPRLADAEEPSALDKVALPTGELDQIRARRDQGMIEALRRDRA